jgi:hypothetical protein
MTDTAGVSFFQFVYRSNPDKTIDAICALCFTTVATAANEAALHEHESAHVCRQNTTFTSPEGCGQCATHVRQPSWEGLEFLLGKVLDVSGRIFKGGQVRKLIGRFCC